MEDTSPDYDDNNNLYELPGCRMVHGSPGSYDRAVWFLFDSHRCLDRELCNMGWIGGKR